MEIEESALPHRIGVHGQLNCSCNYSVKCVHRESKEAVNLRTWAWNVKEERRGFVLSGSMSNNCSTSRRLELINCTLRLSVCLSVATNFARCVGRTEIFVSKEERYACLSVRSLWLTLVGYIRHHKSKCLLNAAAAAAIKGIAIKRPHNTSFMFPFGSVYYLSTHLWDLILLGDFSGFWIQD